LGGCGPCGVRESAPSNPSSLRRLAWVEQNLCGLFEAFLGNRRDNVVGSAFYAVVNFNSKLEMVDAAAQLKLHGRRLKTWDALYEKIRKKSKKRNEIAHFSIVMHGDWSGASDGKMDRVFVSDTRQPNHDTQTQEQRRSTRI
jgi:hypothetical protein